MHFLSSNRVITLSVIGVLATASINFQTLAVAAELDQPTVAEETFATVGDTVITRAEFERVLQRAMRQKFYHFEPPADQREAFRREVAQDLIDRKLLLQEVVRRGIEADTQAVEQQLQAYTKRYAGNPGFEQRRDELTASMRDYLEERDQLQSLEAEVRKVTDPSDADLRAYYEANPDKFTEPARQRLSLILLAVDPSSGSEAWQAAMAEGERLVQQIRDGAEFSELARLHSGDKTAEQGGDMGYLHRGMLAEPAEKAIAELDIGGVADPLRVLEGIAIFKVTERQPAQLRSYDNVTERARDLWRRHQSDTAWEALKRQLRDTTPIKINDPA